MRIEMLHAFLCEPVNFAKAHCSYFLAASDSIYSYFVLTSMSGLKREIKTKRQGIEKQSSMIVYTGILVSFGTIVNKINGKRCFCVLLRTLRTYWSTVKYYQVYWMKYYEVTVLKYDQVYWSTMKSLYWSTTKWMKYYEVTVLKYDQVYWSTMKCAEVRSSVHTTKV